MAREAPHAKHLMSNSGASRMKTYSNLLEETEVFFRQHWNRDALGSGPPAWTEWKTFLFGSVPSHDKSRCYALFEGENLVYVGLGASRGGGIYIEHGLSRRLTAHVICADRARGPQWSKLNDPWTTITQLYTLGFHPDLAHLAAALETFLIRKLTPPRNRKV